MLAQQLDHQFIAVGAERVRVDRRQAPILPLWRKRVRWSAAVSSERQYRLVDPGLCPIPVGAKRQVLIQPDRHGELHGRPSDLIQLAACPPLKVLKEANAFSVPLRVLTNRLARGLKLLRPLVPGGRLGLNQPALFLQRLEGRIELEWSAFRLDKPFEKPGSSRFRSEIRFFPAVGICEKFLVGQIQHGALGGRNGVVIHQTARPQRLERGLKFWSAELLLCLFRAVKFREPLKTDIEFIEIEPTVRRIWTSVVGRGIPQGVQWIESDNSGAQFLPSPLHNPVEIGEIPASPIAIG